MKWSICLWKLSIRFRVIAYTRVCDFLTFYPTCAVVHSELSCSMHDGIVDQVSFELKRQQLDITRPSLKGVFCTSFVQLQDSFISQKQLSL